MLRTWHRQIISIALLLVGIDLWTTVLHAELGDYRLLRVLGLMVLISAVWPLSNKVAAVSDRIDAWLKPRRTAAAIGVATLVALQLFAEAHRFRNEFYLKYHDEHVYMIQCICWPAAGCRCRRIRLLCGIFSIHFISSWTAFMPACTPWERPS